MAFGIAALVCLAGSFGFGNSVDMRAHARIVAEHLSLPFAATSGFLALSTRRPRSGGIALWAMSILWLCAISLVMLPIGVWAINRGMETYFRLLNVQGLAWGLAGLAFLSVAVRAVSRKDGWDLPLGLRAGHALALLILASYLGRGALLAWSVGAVSVGTGVEAFAWELNLGHYVGLLAACVMALSVGARHVLGGQARRPVRA